MPKFELIHSAGKMIQADMRDSLLTFFKDEDLKKLERLGGRLFISLAAPYVTKEKRNKIREIIDINFIKRIVNLKKEPDKIKDTLKNLIQKELRKVCELIGQPIKSNANSIEIISEIQRNILSEDFWQRISNINPKGQN